MTEEIIKFKFHSLSSSEHGLSPEEFCKSMFSILHPTEARQKIKVIDDLLERERVKGFTDYEDFKLIQRFFNEYKKYFKINKTSNFSREKFKKVFEDFSQDYSLTLNNEWAIDNLFNLIDFDENENLEYDELSKFMFRMNTGGRSSGKGENSGIKPWHDFKNKMMIWKGKVEDIIDIINK